MMMRQAGVSPPVPHMLVLAMQQTTGVVLLLAGSRTVPLKYFFAGLGYAPKP